LKLQRIEAEEEDLPKWGVDVEYYRPFASKTRNAFGSSFIGISPGFGTARPAKSQEIRPDLALLRESNDGNRALIIILGAEIRRTFGGPPQRDARYVPYYGAGLNLAYGSIRLDDEGRESDFAAGGSIFVGTSIGRRTFIEARARALSSIEDFNFSGLAVTAGIRF
jgi:hypothetical protein